MNALKYCGLVCALSALAQPGLAQTASVEWSAIAKLTNGRCGDGAIAQVVERAGTMNVKTFINGKQSSEFDVNLKPDGSGLADAKGTMGRVRYEVAPGTGKRAMKSSQLEGNLCQWAWTPR